MTSPRQKKKRLAIKRMKEKLEQKVVPDHKPIVEEKQVPQLTVTSPKPLANPPQPVVDSEAGQKLKKIKTGLVETKSQDQVIEQPKEEVKTQTKE
jgi:hypothetical protein